MASDVLAVLISDLHLSEKAPRCRDDAHVWMQVQSRHLQEIAQVAKTHKACVVIAGDIFHRWDPSPELINFAIGHFKEMKEVYAVAGNHDLPNHRLDEEHRSGYGTLVRAGVIKDLDPSFGIYSHHGLCMRGFPYGFRVWPLEEGAEQGRMILAVAHQYIWKDADTTPTSIAHGEWYIKDRDFRMNLKGYTAALFGDNHTPFLERMSKDLYIYNHGNFTVRTIAEQPPRYGLLHEDGTISESLMKAGKKDRINRNLKDDNNTKDDLSSLHEFVQEMRNIPENRFDFREAIERYKAKHHIPKKVAAVLHTLLEKDR